MGEGEAMARPLARNVRAVEKRMVIEMSNSCVLRTGAVSVLC